METRLISELNHEIAKMRFLAQCIGPYATTKDCQQLRDKLVQTRQRCWELCKHVRDNVVPRLERHNQLSKQPSSRMSDKCATSSTLAATLDLLIKELDKLHKLVISFPLKGSKIYTQSHEDITPIDTFICLTSTGCIVTPDLAEASAAEIRRNMSQMEVNRILRDKKEIEDIAESLKHQLTLAKRESAKQGQNENGTKKRHSIPISRTMSNPIPRRTSTNTGRRTSLPLCCLLYCACKKTYL